MVYVLVALCTQPIDNVFLVLGLHAKVVLHLHHLLAAVSFRYQHTCVGRIGGLAFSTTDVPRIADHELEISIVVNARRKVVVVVGEFLNSHLAVLLASHLEHLQEVLDALEARFLARNEVGVLVHAIPLFQVLSRHEAIALQIQTSKGQLYESLAFLVQRVAHALDKRIEGNTATAILVCGCQGGTNTMRVEEDLKGKRELEPV